MKKKASVSTINAEILKVAEQISKAIELETNEILEDAETVVKKFVPARLVKRTLAKLEEKVENEGVEALFEKAVTREALKRTAADEATDAELDEVINEIVKAIVEELEDVLKDADEVADEEVTKMADDLGADTVEVEAKLKGVLERKLHAKGIYSRFARTASTKKPKTIAEKIRDARKNIK